MTKTKPALSRKTLNIIIFVTAMLILVLSRLGPDEADESGKAVVENSETNLQNTAEAAPSNGRIRDYFPELSDIPEIPTVDISLEIQHWTTPEGLEVYYLPSKALPMVDLRLVFNGGSAQDAESKAGLAQLTAALVKAGAKDMDSNEVALELERMGAEMETGSYRDMAIAGLRVLSDEQYFNESVQLFSKVVSEMDFDVQDFEREKNRQLVGISHKAQSPHAQISDAVFEVLYGQNHPYGMPSSGTLDSVNEISQEDVVQFHEQHYVPQNALLAVVGDIDRQSVERAAGEIASQFKAGSAAESVSFGTEEVKDVHRHIEFPSDQTHIAMVGAGVHRGHEDYYALYLANHILGGGGFASLLNKKIRQERAYAYSVSSSVSPMAGTGLVMVQMQTRGDQAAAAIEATRQVIDELAINGPSPEVLEDAKQQILSEFAMRAASNSSQLGYLGSIGFYDLPLTYLSLFNDKIEGLTAQDIQDMVTRYYQEMAVVTLGRENPLR